MFGWMVMGARTGVGGVENVRFEACAAPRIDLCAGRMARRACLGTAMPLRSSVDGRFTERTWECIANR